MSEITQSVSNYLIPATGSPNAFMVRENFSSSPKNINFDNISLSGIPFRPSGVIIDNTANTDPINVLIPELSYQVECPGGASLMMPYPAPMHHTASITGNGTATVIFVDYPLIPYSSNSTGGSVPNPLPVTGPLTDAQLRATPVNINGALTDSELRANPVIVTIDTTPTYTAAMVVSTTTGTITGARKISFLNTGSSPATVAGGPLAPTASVSIEAPLGGVLSPVAYDATGTSLSIMTVS